MAKVGILSYYKTINYGSVLQAYALQRTIQKLGFECEHIRYTSNRPLVFKLLNATKKPIKTLNTLLSRRTTRGLRYQKFIDEYIYESEKVYGSLSELESANSYYDAFVCGSDQIWAPNQFNERYYLSFVAEKERKIAYAPSIGLPLIPEELKPRMSSLIKDIGFLSVREKQGADLIRELTGIDVPVVLDPTLLLTRDEWLSVSKSPSLVEPYILCHLLGENPQHRKTIRSYAKARKLKTVILPFTRSDYSWGDIVIPDVGPTEYLGLVNGAKIIFTDSYHGMLFSINLNRPFTVFMRFPDNHALCQNSRISSTLDMFNLNNCLLIDGVSGQQTEDEIDYCSVNSIIEKERKRCISFLQQSIQNRVLVKKIDGNA